jgi:hypothetical protein
VSCVLSQIWATSANNKTLHMNLTFVCCKGGAHFCQTRATPTDWFPYKILRHCIRLFQSCVTRTRTDKRIYGTTRRVANNTEKGSKHIKVTANRKSHKSRVCFVTVIFWHMAVCGLADTCRRFGVTSENKPSKQTTSIFPFSFVGWGECTWYIGK